jgi:hypothetical protein
MILSKDIRKKSVKKWEKILLIILISLAILSIFLYYFGQKSHSIFWHMTHPETFEWNNLEITVPKKFISRRIENRNGREKIQIYSLIEKDVGSFFLDNFDRHLKQDFDFDKYYHQIGYKIIEKMNKIISDNPCIWLKILPKNSKKDENEYIEAIYFKNKNIAIYFIGNEKYRYSFENFISKLRGRRGEGGIRGHP